MNLLDKKVSFSLLVSMNIFWTRHRHKMRHNKVKCEKMNQLVWQPWFYKMRHNFKDIFFLLLVDLHAVFFLHRNLLIRFCIRNLICSFSDLEISRCSGFFVWSFCVLISLDFETDWLSNSTQRKFSIFHDKIDNKMMFHLLFRLWC